MDKTRRMSRITAADGKTLIVAMDHAAIMGPNGLERPGEVIRNVIAGGADAVLTTYGIARSFARELAPIGLILRSDGAVSTVGPDYTSAAPIYGVEDALRLGADGIAATTGPGHKNEREQLAWLAKLSSECDKWSMVLMGEMVPGGFEGGSAFRTLEHHRLAARFGSEFGCDLIKTLYCDNFEQVTASCYTPIVVLGGSRMAMPDLLRLVHSAVKAGAIGCAIGRNIWGAPDPARMTAALASIIHDGTSVEDALALLEVKVTA